MLPSKHIGKLGSFAIAAVRIQLQAKLIAASAKERYTDTRFASSGSVNMLVMPNKSQNRSAHLEMLPLVLGRLQARSLCAELLNLCSQFLLLSLFAFSAGTGV